MSELIGFVKKKRILTATLAENPEELLLHCTMTALDTSDISST
jgi:hypothetical protein